MKLPAQATMKEEKFIMIDKKKVVIAEKGAKVTVYNIDHSPVFLCKNIKGETFSTRMDNLIIK